MTLPNSDLKDGTRVVCEYKILTFIGNSLKKRWSIVLSLIQESTATFVLKKRNNPIFLLNNYDLITNVDKLKVANLL